MCSMCRSTRTSFPPLPGQFLSCHCNSISYIGQESLGAVASGNVQSRSGFDGICENTAQERLATKNKQVTYI